MKKINIKQYVGDGVGKYFVSIVILTLTCVFSVQSAEFGSGADMDKMISISTLLAEPKKYSTEISTIAGKVVKVCKKRGCWMDIAADENFKTLTIKVPDGTMVFPLSAIGKKAYATGILSELKLNIKQTKGFLEHRAQENNEKFDPLSVTEGMILYRFSPTGVTIVE